MANEFYNASKEEIISNTQAVHWLRNAANMRLCGLRTVDQLINQVDQKSKICILVKNETKLRGVFYLTITDEQNKRVMSLILLGGIEFPEWAIELRKFIYKLAEDTQTNEFYYMGRAGFSAIFPELKEMSRLYRHVFTSFDLPD